MRLDVVSGERPRTSDESRNPFRFGVATPVFDEYTPEVSLIPGPLDGPAGRNLTSGTSDAVGDRPRSLK